MARFEQVIVSNRVDTWGIPRPTGSAIINVDQIVTIEDCTVDTTYKAFFDPGCPAAVFAAVRITLSVGNHHTLMLGQFADPDEADDELDHFAQWLAGTCLVS